MTQDKQGSFPDKRLVEEGMPSPSGDSGLIDTGRMQTIKWGKIILREALLLA